MLTGVAGETSESAITMSVGGRSMVTEVKAEPEYYKGMGKENLNISTDVEIYICQAENPFHRTDRRSTGDRRSIST
jgi:hypothetical protein